MKVIAALFVIAAIAAGAYYGSAWIWGPDSGNASTITIGLVIGVPIVILLVAYMAFAKDDSSVTLTQGFDLNGDGLKDLFISRRIK